MSKAQAAAFQKPVPSYANCRFNSLHAFRWTDGEKVRLVRYSWLPQEGEQSLGRRQHPKRRERDYLQQDLHERLDATPARPIKFNLRLQLASVRDKLFDPSKRWPQRPGEIVLAESGERRERFVHAGELEVTGIDYDTSAAQLRHFDPRTSRTASRRRGRTPSCGFVQTPTKCRSSAGPGRESRVSTGQRIGNLLGIFGPGVALIAAVVLLWNEVVGWEALVILAAMYVLTGGLGISVGFHRLFAHRSYEAAKPVRATLAVLGTMAMMGPITRWVTNHRKHHSFTDVEGDPHSPHLTGRAGVLGAVTGLWHAHVGWIFTPDRAPLERYARDLLEDPLVAFVSRTTGLWVALGLVIPFTAGLALTATLEGALIAMLWGGPVRVFIVAPPHVLHQLALPLHGPAALQDRR